MIADGTTRSVAERLASAPAFSYREDPAVPAFDDGCALIVYDGVCVLCSRSMRAIARADHAGRIQFVSAQSVLGQALFRHYGLDPDTFETVLLLHRGRAFGKLEAVDEVAGIVGGRWRVVGLLRQLPQWLRDRMYDLVARNRYRLFGRSDTCMAPDAIWRDRVIDHARQ